MNEEDERRSVGVIAHHVGKVLSAGHMPLARSPAPVVRQIPAQGVPVVAVSRSDAERYNTRTDVNGRFSFGLPGGDYDVYVQNVKLARVSMVGYPAEKRSVSLFLPYALPLAGNPTGAPATLGRFALG